MKIKPLYKAIVLSCAALAMAGTSQADINDTLKDMFGNMTNVTSPQDYQGQTRGVFSGGGFSTRNKIMDETLLSVSPPGISGGCGGIDMWGGSLSFINADQMVQLLRSIGSNVLTYGFNLAMTQMCKPCQQTIEELRNIASEMNGITFNSCEIASGVYGDTERPWGSAQDGITNSYASLNNIASGWGDAFKSSGKSEGKSAKETEKTADPDSYNSKTIGNIVWREFVKHNMKNWYQGGDNKLLETLMSITGTVVIGDLEENKDKEKVNPTNVYPGLIGAKDVLNGRKDEKLDIYKCDTYDENGCLFKGSKNTQQINLEGLTERVLDIVIGRNGNIVDRLTSGSGQSLEDDDEIKSFMATAPSGYIAMLRNLSANPHITRSFARKTAPIVALTMVDDFISQALRGVDRALSKSESTSINEVKEQFSKRRQELHEEMQTLYFQIGSVRDIYQHYDILIRYSEFNSYIPNKSSRARQGNSKPAKN